VLQIDNDANPFTSSIRGAGVEQDKSKDLLNTMSGTLPSTFLSLDMHIRTSNTYSNFPLFPSHTPSLEMLMKNLHVSSIATPIITSSSHFPSLSTFRTIPTTKATTPTLTS
jgi:hypothetical protein